MNLCTGNAGLMLQHSLVRACSTCWSCCPSSTPATTWLTFYTVTTYHSFNLFLILAQFFNADSTSLMQCKERDLMVTYTFSKLKKH